MDKIPTWLRWTLCIPTALLAFLALNAINRITFLMIFGDSNGLFFKIGNILVEGTIGVLVLLYVLYVIVPSHKYTAIIVASSSIAILSIIGITLQMINPDTVTPLWQILLPGILAIGSCLYFCRGVLKNQMLKKSTFLK